MTLVDILKTYWIDAELKQVEFLQETKALSILFETSERLVDPTEAERQIIELFPQVLESVRVKETNKNRIMENPDFLQAIEEVEQELASEGGVLVRKSGTEPVIRIMIEGSDLEKIRGLAGRLAGRVKSLDASLGQG